MTPDEAARAIRGLGYVADEPTAKVVSDFMASSPEPWDDIVIGARDILSGLPERVVLVAQQLSES